MFRGGLAGSESFGVPWRPHGGQVSFGVRCRPGRLGRDWRSVAARLLADMVHASIVPDAVTYSAVVSVHAIAGDVEGACRIFADMLAAGVQPNVVTWTSLISACAAASPRRREDAD